MSQIQLSDLIGNENIKTQIAIACGAARLHNKAIGHMLLAGHAGCGKTSTSKAVASHFGGPFIEISAESVRSAEELAKVFSSFPGDGYSPRGEKVGNIVPAVLFIDEAHRLSLKSQEMLGIAMENFRHTYTVGRGKAKKPETIWIPEFTLICATTKEGDLSKPFRDRFKSIFIFDSYSLEESVKIVNLHADRKGIIIDADAAVQIAKRGRGTPRKLVGFLDKIHEYMVFMKRELVYTELVEAYFDIVGIDDSGLDKTDITILKELHEASGSKGLDSLAVKTKVDPRTIMEVHEPFLINLGLLERGRSGRMITDKGVAYLSKKGHIEAQHQELNPRSLRSIT